MVDRSNRPNNGEHSEARPVEEAPKSGKNPLLSVEGAAKAIAGVGLIFYLFGYAVVRTYLSQFGIDDVSFLSPRFVGTGVLYVFILGLTLIGFAIPLFLIYLLLVGSINLSHLRQKVRDLILFRSHVGRHKFRNSPEIKRIKAIKKTSCFGRIGAALLFGLMLTFTLLMVHRLLATTVGGFSFAISSFQAIQHPYDPTPKLYNLDSSGLSKLGLWYVSFLLLWPYFLVITICYGVLVAFCNVLSNWGLLKDNSLKFSKFFLFDLGKIALLFLVLALVLQNIQVYSLTLFPQLDRAIGGGRAARVQLVGEPTEKGKKVAIGEALPLEENGSTKTVPVCLLDQSEKSYYVLLGVDGKSLPSDCITPHSESPEFKNYKAIQLDRGLVKGVVYMGLGQRS